MSIKKLAFCLSAVVTVVTFGGCLSQDFERQSLAKYKTSAGSTFVEFEPLEVEEPRQRFVQNQGMRPNQGRFTSPTGNGRFTAPGGRSGRGGFSLPSGNRFTAPGGFGGSEGQRFTWPANSVGQQRFSMPTEGSVGGRFTWPKQGARQNFSQPNSRFTWPDEPSTRFTSPAK